MRRVVLATVAALALPAGAQAADVGFVCCKYTPKDVRVVVGEAVTWTPGSGQTFDPSPGSANHPLASNPGQGEEFGRSGGTAPYTHTFTRPGTFAYFCTIHGDAEGGGMAGTVTVVQGDNRPPTAAFAVDATDAASGTFAFDAGGPGGSSGPDMEQALSYAWDFGDGTTLPPSPSPSPTARHTFPAPGATARRYAVRLTVTDSNDPPAGASATREVVVPAAAPGPGSPTPPSSPSGAPGPSTTPPSGGPAPRAGLRLALGVPPRLGSALRRGLAVRATPDVAVRVTLELRAAGGGAVLARAPAVQVAAGTTRTLRLRFTPAARMRLRTRGRVAVRLTATARRTSGSPLTARRTLVLRR